MKTKLIAICVIALFSGSVASAETFGQILKGDVNEIVRLVTAEVASEQTMRLKRKVVPTSEFINRAARDVGQVNVDLNAAAARWRLVGLFGVFATHVVEFAASRVGSGEVRLDEQIIDAYLTEAAKVGECYEAPCPMDCKPCNKYCNPCRK
jgi:hypothetical protein